MGSDWGSFVYYFLFCIAFFCLFFLNESQFSSMSYKYIQSFNKQPLQILPFTEYEGILHLWLCNFLCITCAHASILVVHNDKICVCLILSVKIFVVKSSICGIVLCLKSSLSWILFICTPNRCGRVWSYLDTIVTSLVACMGALIFLSINHMFDKDVGLMNNSSKWT